MSPARLALRQIGNRMNRAARRMARDRDVRRSQDALQHHRDQIDILRSHASAITAAQQWHARQVAIAAANLRALGVIEQMPGHPAADAPLCSLSRLGPRCGALLLLLSAGIMAAILWHLVARVAQ